MLRADAGLDAEQAAVGVQRVNGPERREHRAKFEGDERVALLADHFVSGNEFRFGQRCEAIVLEDDGNAAVGENRFHGSSVGLGLEPVAGSVGDKRPGREGLPAEDRSRPIQHGQPLGVR